MSDIENKKPEMEDKVEEANKDMIRFDDIGYFKHITTYLRNYLKILLPPLYSVLPRLLMRHYFHKHFPIFGKRARLFPSTNQTIQHLLITPDL